VLIERVEGGREVVALDFASYAGLQAGVVEVRSNVVEVGRSVDFES